MDDVQRHGRRWLTRVAPRTTHEIHRCSAFAMFVRHARDASGLVDDDDVRVVEHEHTFTLGVDRARGIHAQLDSLSLDKPMVDLRHGRTINPNLPAGDVAFCERPRHAGAGLDERRQRHPGGVDDPRHPAV